MDLFWFAGIRKCCLAKDLKKVGEDWNYLVPPQCGQLSSSSL
jgi:hypothetical protein